MSTPEIVTLVISLFALSLTFYFYLRSGKPITLTGVQQAYEQGLSLASELQKVGLMAVTAAEQLKQTGRINTNEEAFRVAFDYIRSWPGLEKLNPTLVARAVEGSYHMYKQLREVQNERKSEAEVQPLPSVLSQAGKTLQG